MTTFQIIGGAQAKRNFILRASKAQVDLLEDY